MGNAGVVANMVQQFNLQITRSASQISSSPEISSPVDVRHTAGQKPGGAALHKILASNTPSKLAEPQNLVWSGLHVSVSSEETPPTSDATSTPQEKRFSGSGTEYIATAVAYVLPAQGF